MNSRQAFKVAFLADCARRGLDLQATHACVKEALAKALTKKAEIPIFSGISRVLSEFPEGLARMGASLAPQALSTAATTAALAPLIGGGLGGYLLARSQDDDTDVDEAKADELISEYHRLSEQARRNRQRPTQGPL